MNRIFLDGKEIQFKDWSLHTNKSGEMVLTVTYPSNKKFTRSYDEWTIEPTAERMERLLLDSKSGLIHQIERAVEIGEKYFLITYPGNEKIYILKSSQFELLETSGITEGELFNYYKRIAQERLFNAKNEKDRIITQSIVKQFDKIVPCDKTALNAYITKNLVKCEGLSNLIYPFGVNESQLKAVKNAFVSQISIIEGPPGTGKTQTILNIIANIIVNGKTCAIVSNNNLAVENVYDKLAKKRLDFLIARLGRSDKRKAFFESVVYKKPDEVTEPVTLEEIRAIFDKVEEHLVSKNELAKVVCEIQEAEIEKEYLEDWRGQHLEIKVNHIKKYRLNHVKSVNLLAYMTYLQDRTLTLGDKWELLLHYGIFRSKFLNRIKDRESFIFSLQYTYYEELLKEKYGEKEKLDKILKETHFDFELEQLIKKSLEYLNQYLIQHLPDTLPDFTGMDYLKRFSEFMKYFPVIGSSTHSLVSSIANGCLLDYVIIDETSQQDLVPGILCLGCAKNVIVVGDRKQLSHIPEPSEIVSPDSLYDCTKYSLLDSISEIFGDSIPRTLLKEHYRCHPKIIQFCNRQFYANELIPMKEDCGEQVLSLVITSAGNHMRNFKNQREIESVMRVKESCGFLEDSSIGFIAPYNKQIDLAADMMPDDIVKNTIHKFQGRECDEIIFSTVLDKKKAWQKQVDFVDNASMVNVAVSRAKDKFTLVTGDNVFSKNNKYIAALIRYMEYYAMEEDVFRSPVISAFDLLYSEYDKSLETLLRRLNPADSKYVSEQIGAALLRDILNREEFGALVFHKQIYLKQLVSDDSEVFSERELTFMRNRASCDFVIYYRVGKKPMAVVEVDGGSHDKPEQIERDKLKNSILKKAGIPLLRLRTTDSGINETIISFLTAGMYSNL